MHLVGEWVFGLLPVAVRDETLHRAPGKIG
jgi:hypothetical protein